MVRIIIRTNFTGHPTVRHEIPRHDLVRPEKLALLRHVFHEPDRLRPDQTCEAITTSAVGTFADIAIGLRERGHDPKKVARFLDRIVFCLFAEDVRLLPDKLFRRIVEKANGDPAKFRRLIQDLFAAMAAGGSFGMEDIKWFNGSLFEPDEVLELTPAEMAAIDRAHDPDPRGIGTVRYPRVVPKDEAFAKLLAKRTLTNLYNERPTWLVLAHRKLDEAVFAAYGGPPTLTDDELLAKLLALNLERAAAESAAARGHQDPVDAPR
jgi:hypothetical protein